MVSKSVCVIKPAILVIKAGTSPCPCGHSDIYSAVKNGRHRHRDSTFSRNFMKIVGIPLFLVGRRRERSAIVNQSIDSDLMAYQTRHSLESFSDQPPSKVCSILDNCRYHGSSQ